jgi:hypothetical protein
MAMHDTRWFRVEDEWWVARVLTAGGGGWGSGPHKYTHEGVFFRQLADDNEKVLLRCTLVAGELNLVNHSTIVRALKFAEQTELKMYIGPANIPDPDELPRQTPVVDEEGLRWAFQDLTSARIRASGVVEAGAAVEVICLDDSALRRTVPFEDPTTWQDFTRQHGDFAKRALIDSVRSLFMNLTDDQLRDIAESG